MVDSNGIALISRFYNVQTNNTSQELISSALSSVEIVLETMRGNEAVNSIVLPDKVFIFEHRENLRFIIIADEDLLSLHLRIAQFADRFEAIFKGVLGTWNNNINIFTPAEALLDSIFLPKKIS